MPMGPKLGHRGTAVGDRARECVCWEPAAAGGGQRIGEMGAVWGREGHSEQS